LVNKYYSERPVYISFTLLKDLEPGSFGLEHKGLVAKFLPKETPFKVSSITQNFHSQLGQIFFDIRGEHAIGYYNQGLLEYISFVEFNRDNEKALTGIDFYYSTPGRKIFKELQSLHALEGKVRYNLKEYDKAIVSFDKALELNPSRSKMYELKGFSYFYKNDFENAIKSWETAYQLNPSYLNLKIKADSLRKAL
ncbi:tetratricopeptide repeat protein, partial [Bacteroidota bacterium]